MGFISSRGKFHIEGHKDLTKNLAKQAFDDKEALAKLYIPKLVANGQPIDFTVQVGSKVKKGEKIGVGPGFGVPVFAPVSGEIIGEENRYNALVGRPIPHFVLQNDFKNEWGEKLPIIKENASSQEIVDAIKNAGIVGLGGAGFPTFVKYNNVKGLETLVINAVECEPYLTTDYHDMNDDLEMFLKGIQLLMKAASAKEGIIVIKNDKKELIAKINAELPKYPGIRVHEVANKYPMGWERVTIYEATKKEYKALPSEVGVVVNNANTAIAVAHALLKGEPILSRTLTVSGNAIKTPMVLEVPIYLPAAEIIKRAGGYTAEQIDLLAGGPMCGKGLMNDQFVIEKQHGGLTVLKHVDNVPLPCLRCGRCTLVCPASLQPVEIKDAVEKKDIKRITALKADTCIECGSCSFICPSKIEVTDAIRKAKLFLKIEKAKASAQKK